MACKDMLPGNRVFGNRRIQSRDGHVDYTPELVFVPETPEEIQEIIRCAERESPARRVKACGTRWSLNASHKAPDYLILPDGLRNILSVTTRDKNDSTHYPLRSGAFNDSYGFIHTQSGVTFRDVYTRAMAYGAAMPTQAGGAGETTIAGITATGTHGSDHVMGCIADYIRAIHLVGSGGRQYWIEPGAPKNITDPDGWGDAAMDTSNLEIIYNDDVFNAAIISFGRFGVIYSLVYEVIPAYYVLERRDKYHWPTIKNIILNNTAQDLFNSFRWSNHNLPQDYENTEGRTFKIDMSLGTYREGADSSMSACYLTRRAKTAPDGGPYVHPGKFILKDGWEVIHNIILDPNNLGLILEIGFQNPGDFVHVLSDSLFHGNNDRLATLLNGVSNEPRRKFTEFLFGEMVEPHPSGYAYGPSWFLDGVTDPTPPLPPGDSLEYMFDANHPNIYLELADYVLNVAKSPQIVGWLSLRYSKGTHALLGMHQYENTVAVEISFLKDITGNQDFLNLVRQKARELGGIPHWGQMHDFQNRRELEGYYGNKLHTWLKALSRLSRYGNASTFENEFTANLGLRPARVDNLLFMESG